MRAALTIAVLLIATPAHSQQYVETARCGNLPVGDTYPNASGDSWVWSRDGSDYRSFPATPRKVWCRADRVGPPLKPVAPIVHRPASAPKIERAPVLKGLDVLKQWIADTIGERG